MRGSAFLRSFVIGGLLLGGVVQGVEAQAAPTSRFDAEARAEFDAGRDAYDRGKFREALVHYERAYQLSPRPQLLFNIARAADSDGQSARAIEAYELYLERMQDAENREFAEARLSKLREGQGPEVAGQTGVLGAPEDFARGASAGAGPASAEPSLGGRMRLYAGLYMGVGGSWKEEVDAYDASSTSTDLKPSPGGQLGFEFLLLRYLGLGAEVRLSAYKGDDWATSDRDLLTDIVLKPTGRFPVPRTALELYAGLPVGLTIPALSDPEEGEFKGSVGGTLSLAFGATYRFSERIGLNLDAGYGWRWFGATYEDYIDYIEGDVTVKQGYLALNLVVFAGQPPR